MINVIAEILSSTQYKVGEMTSRNLYHEVLPPKIDVDIFFRLTKHIGGPYQKSVLNSKIVRERIVCMFYMDMNFFYQPKNVDANNMSQTEFHENYAENYESLN